MKPMALGGLAVNSATSTDWVETNGQVSVKVGRIRTYIWVRVSALNVVGDWRVRPRYTTLLGNDWLAPFRRAGIGTPHLVSWLARWTAQPGWDMVHVVPFSCFGKGRQPDDQGQMLHYSHYFGRATLAQIVTSRDLLIIIRRKPLLAVQNVDPNW